MEITSLEKNLNNHDIRIRMEAVFEISRLLDQGHLSTPQSGESCNLHTHTFFSYNAFGHSPSSLAWLARREGIRLMGIVDFDTLEGTDEFLWACDQFNLRGTVSLETRVYLPEFADRAITSKGQPGVAYYLLSGFTAGNLTSQAQSALSELQSFLSGRNLRIVQSLNDYLYPLSVDYNRNVVSLSAGDTPTERHIMQAYYEAAVATLDNPLIFWSEKLGLAISEIERSYSQPSLFRRIMREKLVKSGGVACQAPGLANYPSIELINRLADLSGSFPTLVWANGTSKGEREEKKLLEFLMNNDLQGINIVPQRSINVPESEKESRIKYLYEIVDLAAQFDLPIFIGTEMNQPGHQLVDDLDLQNLAFFKQTFMNGAYLLYGHTMLARHANLGYRSAWAEDQFNDRRSRNDFYTHIGASLPNTLESREFLRNLPNDLSAQDLSALLKHKYSNSPRITQDSLK